MQKLLIKYRFQGYPYIVADGKGIFYQLPHSTNSYYKSFRQLNQILNNEITEGYRRIQKVCVRSSTEKKSICIKRSNRN